MHTDLLDTVLVSRKEGTFQGERGAGTATSATIMKGLGSDAAKAGEEEKCPVDHKTRELWVQQARAGSLAEPPAVPAATQPGPAPSTTIPAQHTQSSTSSWSSWLRLPSFSQQSQESATANTTGATRTASPLDEARVISSIPRSSDPGPTDPEQTPAPQKQAPVNHEQETGASASGHWVYPSEKQFFDAMKRKGFDAAATDMKTVVPIHNAVNERAWGEILKWEAPYVAPANQGCGGPRLHSFAGLGSATMSPKARINTLLGYTAPFDRHDWVVDRCGTKVEYVIDFYAGRNGGNGANKLNFYLDVRPKLNSWEGVKMRAMRASGLA